MSLRLKIPALTLVSMLAFGTMPSVHASSAKTSPFKAAYKSSVADLDYNCSGVRIVKASAWTKDSETCLIIGPDVLRIIPGTYVSTPSWFDANVGLLAMSAWMSGFSPYAYGNWQSDFNDEHALAKQFTFVVVRNGDGSVTQTIEAYYL